MRKGGATQARRDLKAAGQARVWSAVISFSFAFCALAGLSAWAATTDSPSRGTPAVTAAKATADGPSDAAPDGPEKTAPKKISAAKSHSYGIPQVELINDQIRAAWQARKMTPSSPATEGEWCRRLFLDLLGRVPSAEEVTRFTSDRSADKKLQLVNQLLGTDEQYIEQYARNWTTLWTNILIGRAGGGEKDRMTNRQGLQQSLRRAFQRNTPYDKLVFDLISATGVNRPGEAGFNGYVNFLSGKLEDNAVQATAKTSQIFLGLQVQCTQCHNHPFNEWKQNQFWELNAFFRQTQLRRVGDKRDRDNPTVELVNQNFLPPDSPGDEAAIFYELRNGKMEVAYPAFVDGTATRQQERLSGGGRSAPGVGQASRQFGIHAQGDR